MQKIKCKFGIVGANSYIARNLIQVLKNRYAEVSELYLYDLNSEHIDGCLPYVQIDLLDKQSLEKIDYDCDFLYVFAGLTGTMQGFEQYESFIELNEVGLLNILNCIIAKKSKTKLIFPSTRLLYKGIKDTPLQEDAEKEFKTVYAINKYACEQYLKMYQSVYEINYAIFRICVPYGSLVENSTSYGTASAFIEKAIAGEIITIYGDGGQKRTFTYIDDLCEALIKGAMSEECRNEAYNIGGADHISVYDSAIGIAELYGAKVKCVDWPEFAKAIESGDTIFDSSKFDSITHIKYRMHYDEWVSLHAKI